MRRRPVALLAAAALTVGGCSDDGEKPPPAAVVRVFAASSLTEVFNDLGQAYTMRHADVRIDFTFSTSDVLYEQIERGGAASILATADPAVMNEAEADGFVRNRTVFARNRLALVVREDDEKGIGGFGDLERDSVTYAACDEEVVCGSLARTALEEFGVRRPPVSTERTARLVVQQVATAHVDAGVVFVTTPLTDGVHRVAEIDQPDLNAVYELSVLAGAVAVEESQAWVAFVLGDSGRRILEDHGFALP